MNQLSLFPEKDNFESELKNMLLDIIHEEELPTSSLHLYSNISPKTQKEISKSICIYEPDYPSVKIDIENPGKNFVVMNIQKYNPIELLIRNQQFNSIKLPSAARIKSQNSDKNFVHVLFDSNCNDVFAYIKANICYCLSHYQSKARSFGCCSKFVQCSDAKKCVHENKLYSTSCAYRNNLESGRIFYGVNKNV